MPGLEGAVVGERRLQLVDALACGRACGHLPLSRFRPLSLRFEMSGISDGASESLRRAEIIRSILPDRCE